MWVCPVIVCGAVEILTTDSCVLFKRTPWSLVSTLAAVPGWILPEGAVDTEPEPAEDWGLWVCAWLSKLSLPAVIGNAIVPIVLYGRRIPYALAGFSYSTAREPLTP